MCRISRREIFRLFHQLVTRSNILISGTWSHDRLLRYAAGKVTICCALPQKYTYVTVSPHQLALLSSSLPSFFLWDSGRALKTSHRRRYPLLSLSPSLVVFLSVLSLSYCLPRSCGFSVSWAFVFACKRRIHLHRSVFFPSLCLFDYAIVSTLLLLRRALSASAFVFMPDLECYLKISPRICAKSTCVPKTVLHNKKKKVAGADEVGEARAISSSYRGGFFFAPVLPWHSNLWLPHFNMRYPHCYPPSFLFLYACTRLG